MREGGDGGKREKDKQNSYLSADYTSQVLHSREGSFYQDYLVCIT